MRRLIVFEADRTTEAGTGHGLIVAITTGSSRDSRRFPMSVLYETFEEAQAERDCLKSLKADDSIYPEMVIPNE